MKQTDEKLLQFLIAIIDAKLFEAIDIENFETVNIQHTNNSSWNVVASICPLYFDGTVNPFHNPREETVV